jgi:hypothetical protein
LLQPHNRASSCLQASPGALLRLDVSDVWFGEAGGAGAGSMFPALADLFKDPHGSAGLSL